MHFTKTTGESFPNLLIQAKINLQNTCFSIRTPVTDSEKSNTNKHRQNLQHNIASTQSYFLKTLKTEN